MQIILTEFVFKRYPEYAEGMLTKIRSAMADQSSFARLARMISLGEFIMLGKGEIECGGSDRDSTLSDAFESVVGAIFLDSNLEKTRVSLKYQQSKRFSKDTTSTQKGVGFSANPFVDM